MEVIRRRRDPELKGLCEHCGNVTHQVVLRDIVTGPDERTYLFCQCTICKEVILRMLNYDWRLQGGGPLEATEAPAPLFGETELMEPETLWPPSLSLPSEAPKRVRKLYEEASLVRRQSPSSFAVLIGRAMEAVVTDKNAAGTTLHDKLNSLVDRNDLPEVFGRMAQANRIIRNWGAHDADIDVVQEDVEVVDQFFRAFIEYLYVAPAKVKQVEQLISKRKRGGNE